jgi:hypothetical protein
MTKTPTELPTLDAVQLAFQLMSAITDVADHMSPNYGRAFLAMQLLNSDLSVPTVHALGYLDQIPED